jgi:putative membrane protein
MPYLLVLHVVTNLIWIGSILAVAVLLARAPGDAKQRGGAGLLVFRWLALPSSSLAVLFGLVQLGMNLELYLRLSHWMHGKLPLALVVLGLTHALGARARRMASGEVTTEGPALAFGGVIFAFGAVASALALLKPF